MLNFCLFMLSFVGYILFLCWKFKLKPEEGPIISSSFLILVLYISALLGLLQPLSYIVLYGGLALFLVVVILNLKDIKTFALGFLRPGFVIYLLGIPVLFYLSYHVIYSNWDEFSHWGIVVKAMSISNSLPTQSSMIPFASYPPGTALYQYFLCNLFGYREGIVVFAHVLLVWSGAVVFTKRFGWNRVPIVILILLLLFAGYIHFSNSMWCIYVDGLLGLLVGCVIAIYYQTDKRETSDIIKTYPLIALIALVKESGIFLCVLLFVFISVDQLFLARNKIGVTGTTEGALQKHKYKLLVLMVLILPVAVNISWTLHLNAAGISSGQSIVQNVFFDHADKQINEGLLPSFLMALAEQPVGLTRKGFGGISTSAVILLVCIAMLCVYVFISKNKLVRKRQVILISTIVGLFALYCIGLWAVFTFKFNSYEGTRFASFSRYMGTILYPIVLIIPYVLLSHSWDPGASKHDKFTSVIMGIVLIGFLLCITPSGYLNILARKTADNDRSAIVTSVKTMKQIADPNDKVFIIWQNTTGKSFLMTKYELYPHAVNSSAWSIGTPYGSADIWTKEMTAQQWSEKLIEYQFVYIGSADAQFVEQFGALFPLGEVKNNSLYSVNIIGNDKVELLPVTQSQG